MFYSGSRKISHGCFVLMSGRSLLRRGRTGGVRLTDGVVVYCLSEEEWITGCDLFKLERWIFSY